MNPHALLNGPSIRQSNKCVVCFESVAEISDKKFCKELLHCSNVGNFLVENGVVQSETVSLNSPICRLCCHLVTTADKLIAVAKESIDLLRSRHPVQECGGIGNGEVKLSDKTKECSSRNGSQSNSDAAIPEPVSSRRHIPEKHRPTKPREESKVPSLNQVIEKPHPTKPDGSKMSLREKLVPFVTLQDFFAKCKFCGKNFPNSTAEDKVTFRRHLGGHKGRLNALKKRPKSKTFAQKKFAPKPHPHPIAVEEPRNSEPVQKERPPEASPPVGPGLVKCRTCHQVIYKDSMAAHIKSCRPTTATNATIPTKKRPKGGGRFKCELCHIAYRWKGSLDRHVRKAHKVKTGRVLGAGVGAHAHAQVDTAPVSGSNHPPLDNYASFRHAEEEDVKPSHLTDAPAPTSSVPAESSKKNVVRSFPCQVCNKTFYGELSLRTHECHERMGPGEQLQLKVEENDETMIAQDTDPGDEDNDPLRLDPHASPRASAQTDHKFPCPLCTLTFHKKGKRRDHITSAHPDACRCCGGLSCSGSSEEQLQGTCIKCLMVVPHLNAHTVWEHKARYCGWCTASFGSQEALTTHEWDCRLKHVISTPRLGPGSANAAMDLQD